MEHYINNDKGFGLYAYTREGFLAGLKTLLNDGRNNTIKIGGDYSVQEFEKNKYYLTAYGCVDVNHNKEFYSIYHDKYSYFNNPSEAFKLTMDNFVGTIMEALSSYISKDDELYNIARNIEKKEELRNPLKLGSPKVKTQLEELYNKIFKNN